MIVLMVMIWLYRSIDFEGIQLDAPAVFSSVSAGVLLQAVSIGFIALISKVDTAATVAITLPYLLRLVVVDPLAEELCFRGVSLTVLEAARTAGSGAANLIQAALFAAFHFSIVQSAYAFVCALVLGGLRQRDGIGSSVVAHCACNLSGVILGLVLASLA